MFNLDQKMSLKLFQILLVVFCRIKHSSLCKTRTISRNFVDSEREILRQSLTEHFRTFQHLVKFPFTTSKMLIDI